jgi:hypothetical protein
VTATINPPAYFALLTDPAALARLGELMLLPKSVLITTWREHNRHTWTAHPVTTWRKEEVAWDIVEAEMLGGDA